MAGVNRYEQYIGLASSDWEGERYDGIGVPLEDDGLWCAVHALMALPSKNWYICNLLLENNDTLINRF